MSDKQPTQAMPDGQRDSAAAATEAAELDSRENGGGGGLPRPETGKQDENRFRGGQSERAYHGPHQLGEQQVDDRDNPNAPAGSD